MEYKHHQKIPRLMIITNDLEVPMVCEVIIEFSEKYSMRLENHTNIMAINLEVLDNSEHSGRLKPKTPLGLRFKNQGDTFCAAHDLITMYLLVIFI